MNSDTFSQSREDALEAQMQRDEWREMQDTRFEGPYDDRDDYPDDEDDLDPRESCLQPLTEAEERILQYRQDSDWHLCMLTPQPREYE